VRSFAAPLGVLAAAVALHLLAGCAATPRGFAPVSAAPPLASAPPQSQASQSSYEGDEYERVGFGSSRWERRPHHGWSERVALHYGVRRMDPDLLPGADDDPVFGLELAGSPPGAPIEFAVGLFGSGSFGPAVTGEDGDSGVSNGQVLSTGAAEFSFGLRLSYPFLRGALWPHVGTGLSALRVQREEATDSGSLHLSDSTTGIYAEAGLTWLGRGGWTFGLTYRELMGTRVRLGNDSGDADYRQFTLSLGVLL
jgi:hypothetical protein